MISKFELCMQATSPKLSARQAVQLASICIDDVRLKVAENSRTPEGVLNILSDDSNAEVRSAVALNLSTPEPVLMNLVNDEDPDVRFMIASCAYMPRWVLIKLFDDENPYVAVRAGKTLRRLSRFVR
jgi:HEAT repeat protein